MRVTSLQLKGFRSFESMERIGLGPINVLVGANNAGKSSILKALYSMQQGSDNGFADVRVGGTTAQIDIGLEDMSNVPLWGSLETGMLRIEISSNDRRSGGTSWTIVKPDGSGHAVNVLPGADPQHFVVPYLSKRKTTVYQEDVRNQYALQVTPNMEFLAAKLSRISNPSFPGHERYRDTCNAILGFMVTAIPSENGQRPGLYLSSRETIPIDQMGEGVPNIVMLLADLALSDRKLFLIEEPENDLHPAALKALLDLIIESSATNQFVISTHSNIVLRNLGSAPSSQVYEITAMPGKLPVEASIRVI